MIKSRSFLGVVFALIVFCQPAFGQWTFKVGQLFVLPTGVKVKIIAHVPPKKDEKNVATGLILEIQSPNVKIGDVEKISDMFFGHFWGPSIESQGKTRGSVHIQLPGYKANSRTAIGKRSVAIGETQEYERKEPHLWIPVGRPIPNWLRASQGKQVRLSNGDVVWLERASPYYSQIVKSKTFAFYIRGNWASTGSRPAFELIRRFATERLRKLREQHKLVSVVMFRTEPKDGFHFRPQVKAFVLRKSPSDFWLVQKFAYTQLSGDGSKASMIWYVPSVPVEQMTPEALANEAKLLQSQFGAKITENDGLKTSIIMAIWPADEIGDRVMRYGTKFVKNQNGEWRLKPGKKRN